MPSLCKNLLACAAMMLVLTACQKDKIETTQIPKEVSMPMPSSVPEEPAAPAQEIEWTVPTGWSEQAPSSMRVGSFLIKGADGQTADMSVVPLSGEAGGDIPNINRWRGQLNLVPINQTDLSAQSETIHPAGRKMLYIDFVSQDLLINNKHKKRLIAAVYHLNGKTWFFKMMGEDATVLSAKAAFTQFLKSLKFNEAS